MECWRFWKTYFFKIKKFYWYGNDSVSWYFFSYFYRLRSLSKLPISFLKLLMKWRKSIWNFKSSVGKNIFGRNIISTTNKIDRNIFWCWNIIPTKDTFGVEILFPPRIFLVLKYHPHHQWNNIVIPTPGNFMGKLRSSVMGVNFLYYPIEFALTLSFQAFTKEFILSWEVTNKVIFAICIDPSSTINPTKFLLANIVILFNLFSLVLCWRNPYFSVKVHSRGSQSHFLTTTSHISICQHKASITKIHKKYFSQLQGSISTEKETLSG